MSAHLVLQGNKRDSKEGQLKVSNYIRKGPLKRQPFSLCTFLLLVPLCRPNVHSSSASCFDLEVANDFWPPLSRMAQKKQFWTIRVTKTPWKHPHCIFAKASAQTFLATRMQRSTLKPSQDGHHDLHLRATSIGIMIQVHLEHWFHVTIWFQFTTQIMQWHSMHRFHVTGQFKSRSSAWQKVVHSVHKSSLTFWEENLLKRLSAYWQACFPNSLFKWSFSRVWIGQQRDSGSLVVLRMYMATSNSILFYTTGWMQVISELVK